MRRIRKFLFCLMAVVVIFPPVRAQDAKVDVASEEVPLYREFRVLSGLPWKEAGATRKTVLERIFHEPHILVRREVLREYARTDLPVQDFPAAFDECIALEQADFPGAVAEIVMREWAERDPLAAIKRCETLFDLVIEGAPLDLGGWDKPIQTGDLEKLQASSYWFGNRDVVEACWKGIAAASWLADRRKVLQEKFTTAYERRFHEKPPEDVEEPAQRGGAHYRNSYADRPANISTNAGMRGELLRLLATPPEEIPATFKKWPGEPWDDLMFSRGLIRWMSGDGKKASQIVERVLDAYDPRHFYRSDDVLMDVIPGEFLVEWAILDEDGFLAWMKNNGRLCGWRAYAVCQAVMPKLTDHGWELSYSQPSSKTAKSECNHLWIALDPQGALPMVLEYSGETYAIDHALDRLWRSDPPANYWRRAMVPYIRLNHHGGGNEAWGVTTAWGPVDFRAMVKQYGMPWCLHSGEFKASQVPGMFSNRQALEDDSGLRNTLSALRTWAILRPKEMRAWIDGGKFTPDLREALLWLLDHAAGGFAVPAPAEPR